MKPLKSLLPIILLFAFYSSSATGINFIAGKAWKEVLQMAKKQNKLIFLDAYATWCGPCKYLQSSVFTNDKVGIYYNKTFINVKMDMEEGEGIQLAEKFEVVSYPTLFFINGDGEIVHKQIGAMEVSEFLELGNAAVDPNKQYFTVKKNAAKGLISPKYFHTWIHAAEDLEDPDTDSLITKWLNATKNTALDKDKVEIMIAHASLTRDQIDYIMNNKEICKQLTSKTEGEFNEDFLRSVANYATVISLKNEIPDYALFQKTVAAYYPNEALSETTKMKIRFYNYNEEYAKSLDELGFFITKPEMGLKAADLADLILTYRDAISNHGLTDEFIQKIKDYNMIPKEITLSYYKDYALLALYLQKEDKGNIIYYGYKIIDDLNAPEKIKSTVKKAIEDN